MALSTMEAEYIALTHAAKEAIWLRTLLNDVIGPSAPKGATCIFCDNKSALALTRDNAYHSRTKHIDIHYHFIRERIASNEVEVIHCASEENVADLLTKPLPRPRFKTLVERLGMRA